MTVSQNVSDNILKIGTFDLNRSAMIEASAGTGKTYTITYLVLRLLLGSQGFIENDPEAVLEKGYSKGPIELRNILVVTFTNAAASDLKNRIRENIVQARTAFEEVYRNGYECIDSLDIDAPMKALIREMCILRKISARTCALILLNAERSIDEAPICTIHSFCTSTLHKIYTLEAGESFDEELSVNIAEQTQEAVNNVWRKLFYSSDARAKRLSDLLIADESSKSKKTVNRIQPKAINDIYTIINSILPKVRNTSSKEGHLGFNILGLDNDARDCTAAINTCLDKADRLLNAVMPLIAQCRRIFDNYRVLDETGEASDFFLNKKGQKASLLAGAADALKELYSICKSEESDTVTTYLRSGFSFVKYDHFISYLKREKYESTLVNAQEIILLEELYFKLQTSQQEIARIRKNLLFEIAIMVIRETDVILKRDKLIDFDGIIRRLDDVLNYQDGSKDLLPALIRSSYQVAMIDEFQDTDPTQFSIFRRLYLNDEARKSCAFCYLIGDPKQSIYGFRRADIHSYLKARSLVEKLYGKESVYTLNVNYRSQEQVVHGVNRIFEYRNTVHSDTPDETEENSFFFKNTDADAITFLPVSAKIRPEGSSGKYSFRFSSTLSAQEGFAAASSYVEFIESDDDSSSSGGKSAKYSNKTKMQVKTAQCTARAVSHALLYGILDEVKAGETVSRQVEPSDIAILVQNEDQSDLIRNALRELGIPSVYYSDTNRVFDEDNNADSVDAYTLMTYLLEAMEDYTSQGKVRRLLMSQLCPTDFVQNNAYSGTNLEAEITLLKECRGIWDKNGFYPAFSRWANDERHLCLKQNLQYENGERTVTNLWHLAELLQSARSVQRGIQAELNWFATIRTDSSDMNADTFRKRLESESRQVSIYTIFKSKGLEFPLVFMPFIWNNLHKTGENDLFYYNQNDEKLYFDLTGSEKTFAQKKLSDMQENARLLYVALTRACAANFLYIPRINDLVKEPNAFVSEFNRNSFSKAFDEAFTFFTSYTAHNKEEKKPFVTVDDSFYSSLKNPHRKTSVSYRPQSPSAFAENFRGITDNFKISSYSGIVRQSHVHSGETVEYSHLNYDRFNFPHGALGGNYLHKVLELCDFAALKKDSLEQLDNNAIRNAIYNAKNTPEGGVLREWKVSSDTAEKETLTLQTEVLCAWLSDVVSARLPGADLRLCDLQKKQWLAELEFLFSAKNFDSEKLIDLRRKNARDFAGKFSLDIESFDFSLNKATLSGFIQGFIDLTLEKTCDGVRKFYVADYKSNYISSSIEDYTKQSVAANMLSHSYDVQYLFYTLALHRFLKNRIAQYDYDTNFGGIIYLYLRGMKKESDNAVVFIKPKKEIINELELIFSQEQTAS